MDNIKRPTGFRTAKNAVRDQSQAGDQLKPICIRKMLNEMTGPNGLQLICIQDMEVRRSELILHCKMVRGGEDDGNHFINRAYPPNLAS